MNKKESKSMLKSIINSCDPYKESLTYEEGGTEYAVEVSRFLDPEKYEDYIQFILAVVLNKTEDGFISYNEEYLQLAEFIAMVKFYTDINLSDFSLKDADRMRHNKYFYNFIMTNSVMDYTQIETLRCAAENRIHRILNKNQKSSFDILIEKFSDYMDEMKGAFSGVPSEDISAFIKNIAQIQNVDEEALADAVVSQIHNHTENVNEENEYGIH